MSGFIYVMSNASFNDNLVKIGKSTRDPSRHRVIELRTTGVPGEFSVEYYALVENEDWLEIAVHKFLSKYRYKPDREFFEISIPKAIDAIKSVAGSSIEHEKLYYKDPEEVQKERERREEEEKQKEQKESEEKEPADARSLIKSIEKLDISEDTLLELAEFKMELQYGSLEPMDLDYLRFLYRRLMRQYNI